MPRNEIQAVLATDDPELVCRYLELHRERLEERLAAGLRTLQRIERSVTTAMLDRPETNVMIDAEPQSTYLTRFSIPVSHGASPLRPGMRN